MGIQSSFNGIFAARSRGVSEDGVYFVINNFPPAFFPTKEKKRKNYVLSNGASSSGVETLVLARSSSLTACVVKFKIPDTLSCKNLVEIRLSASHLVRRLLLLLLSRFSRVRLCATPEMAAHQAPTSLGFSKQEHWSGLPFPSPMHESEK